MLATLQGGQLARDASLQAMLKAQQGYPAMLSEAATPLEEIASFTRKEVQDLTAFAASKGVTAKIMAGGPQLAGNAYYYKGDPRLSSIVDSGPAAMAAASESLRKRGIVGGPMEHIGIGSSSTPMVMHEIGHATPILGSTKLRDAFNALANLSGGLPGNAVRALLMANAIAQPGEDESGARAFARDHAAALIAGSSAPHLLEEARATGHALRGARQFGPGVSATARELVPAFGTYAARAAAPVLATLIAQRLMEFLRSRKTEEQAEKQAAPTAGKEVQSPGILRASASSAWHTGLSAPKPKTTKPNTNPSARAKDTPTAKPPSKTAYYTDTIKSLNNPQRGFRGAKPG